MAETTDKPALSWAGKHNNPAEDYILLAEYLVGMDADADVLDVDEVRSRLVLQYDISLDSFQRLMDDIMPLVPTTLDVLSGNRLHSLVVEGKGGISRALARIPAQ